MKKKYQARSLTRGEVKALKKAGYTLSDLMNMNNGADALELLEFIAEDIFELPDDMEQSEANNIVIKSIMLTFGVDDDIKNSAPPVTGTGATVDATA